MHCADYYLHGFSEDQRSRADSHLHASTILICSRGRLLHSTMPRVNVSTIRTLSSMTSRRFNESSHEALATAKTEFENSAKNLRTKKSNKARDELFSAGKKALPAYKALLRIVAKQYIPRYERTRRVKLVSNAETNDVLLVCDCGRMRKNGQACRHIYKVLNRLPTRNDAKIRWTTAYSYYYGRNGEMTTQLTSLRDHYTVEGVPLLLEEAARINSQYNVGEGESSLEYFHRSLDKIRLRGPNYWQGICHKFSNIGPECFGCEPTIALPNKLSLKSTTPSVASMAPVGTTQEIHCHKSTHNDEVEFNVASVDNFLNSDEDDDNITSGMHELDPHFEHMPMYNQCTKLQIDDKSKKMIADALRDLRGSLHAHARKKNGVGPIQIEDSNEGCNTMESMPQTLSRIKQAKRKTKPSSPHKTRAKRKKKK